MRRRTGRAGTVALTFDDGPDPRFTPQVLDVLAEEEAVATFFLVGARVERYPELVRRILDEGHAVGSHTWSHPDLERLPWPELLREIRRGRRAVEEAAGRSVRAFRPPHGHLSLPVAVAARFAGVSVWNWSIDAADWHPGRSRAEIVEALAPVRSEDVILLHDALEQPRAPEVLDRSATVGALRPLLSLLRERRLEPIALGRP